MALFGRTLLSFTGIELGSVLQNPCLPPEKEYLNVVQSHPTEVKSLTGFSKFACSVVFPGRLFCKDLLTLQSV